MRRLQDTERPEEAASQFGGLYGPLEYSAEAARQRSVRAQTSTSTFYLDSNDTEVNRTVNLFELPPRDTAQMLLDGYKATV